MYYFSAPRRTSCLFVCCEPIYSTISPKSASSTSHIFSRTDIVTSWFFRILVIVFGAISAILLNSAELIFLSMSNFHNLSYDTAIIILLLNVSFIVSSIYFLHYIASAYLRQAIFASYCDFLCFKSADIYLFEEAEKSTLCCGKFLAPSALSFVVPYKRGFVISDVVSLTMGNSSIPTIIYTILRKPSLNRRILADTGRDTLHLWDCPLPPGKATALSSAANTSRKATFPSSSVQTSSHFSRMAA